MIIIFCFEIYRSVVGFGIIVVHPPGWSGNSAAAHVDFDTSNLALIQGNL